MAPACQAAGPCSPQATALLSRLSSTLKNAAGFASSRSDTLHHTRVQNTAIVEAYNYFARHCAYGLIPAPPFREQSPHDSARNISLLRFCNGGFCNSAGVFEPDW